MNIHTRTLLIAALTVATAGNLLAAEPAPKKGKAKTKGASQQQTEAPKPDPVREALNGILAEATACWSAKDFAVVRERCGKVQARTDAPPHFRSYAHLRIAQSYAAEGNTVAAKAEYEKIQSNTAYPEVHRYEAGECLKELERVTQGLPARDPAASRTKVPAITTFAVEFFVAPAGNDSNPGTRQKPFASLEKARDAIRALKAKGPVAVRLLPGEYNVTKTFELAKEDSGTEAAPIVYRADQKGTAVLYGGTRLNGFVPVTDPTILERLPVDARGKVFQCDLKKLGITDCSPLTERGSYLFWGGKNAPHIESAPATLEVFFNGAPLTLARWPNAGFVNGGKITQPKSKDDTATFEYLDDRHVRWGKTEDGWLKGYFRNGFDDNCLRIQHIDTDKKQITCGPVSCLMGHSMEPVKWFNNGGIKYFVFNLLEEMDQPGEWYLDRKRAILYFYPPSDPAKAVVEIGMLSVPMLRMNQVSHVRWEGLVFDLSRVDCMSLKDCDNCLVAGCTVKRFAGSGIAIIGGREDGILGCDLYHLGRGATEVTGGDRETLTPARHFVENCLMSRFGRLDYFFVYGVAIKGVGIRVAHNLFSEHPSSVVRADGNDHVIEYNRVHRAALIAEDQGAMELFGNPTYRGVIFRYNFFSDTGSRADTVGHAGRAGIRLDDVISGIVLYGNLFHRSATGVFGGVNINGGRDNIMDNNIFAECQIGISGKYSANNKNWAKLGKDSSFILSERFLQRYPDLQRLQDQPGLNNAWRNIFWKCGPSFNTYGKPSEDQFDRLANAEYASDDPGFADAAKGDFRLRPDAPLFTRIGFRPIPVEEIGLYQDDYRATWPVELRGATTSQTWRLGQRNGRDCLLTPAGKPFMILGLSHAGGGLTSAEKTQGLATLKQDLRDLHFNAVGYVPELVSEFAYIHNADRLLGSPGNRGLLLGTNKHLYQDVFDPAFKARLNKQIQDICARTAGDANCIGYWWTDIPCWELGRQRQRFGKSYVDFIRDLPESAPGRIRYEQHKKQNGGGDDAGFLVLIARELYTATAEYYRQFAPDRLLFGERYGLVHMNLNTPLEIIAECGKVVDVVSFQPTEKTLSGEIFDKIHAMTGKPIVLSDWNLSFPVDGYTYTQWPQFPNEAEAAKGYEAYLVSAFAKPYILGYYKCQYRDANLARGGLKQGLRAQDGKLYGDWAQSIARIHQSLLATFEKGERFTTSP